MTAQRSITGLDEPERLPSEARSWRVRPGEELASDDLPEAPR